MIPPTIVGYKKSVSGFSDSEKKPFPFKDVLTAGLCCGIPLFIGGNLQQLAFNYIEVGKVGFITALYMLIVPLVGLFLKRKIRPNVWIGVILGTTGLYFLSVPENDFSIGKGELITVACAFAFAAHILVTDRFCRKIDAASLSCAQFLVAGTLSLICAFIFEEPEINGIFGAWSSILYAGVMSCGVAFTLQILGQKYTEPAAASILLCLESVFSVIFGWLLLRQRLSNRELLGCFIMFTAIALSQTPASVFKVENKRGFAKKNKIGN